MKINKDNYELFFLDYHEQNLSAEMVAELFLFLEKNPDLKDEFESFQIIPLPEQSTVKFPDKEFLKKGIINTNNFQHYFIGKVEGTLTHEEQLQLEQFLIDFPAYKKDLSLFEKTKLQPVFSIIYEAKQQLKKPIPLYTRPESWYYVAAAACILFLMGILYFNLKKETGPEYTDKEKLKKEAPAILPVPEKLTAGNKGIPAIQKDINNKGNQAEPLTAQKDSRQENKINNKPTKINIDKVLANQIRNEKNKVKHMNKPDFNTGIRENMALLEPIAPTLFAEHQELSLTLHLPKQPATVYYKLTASSPETPSYLSIGEVFKQYSEDKIKTALNDKPLANELLSNRVPGKAKGIKFIGWCLEKVTGKKVDVKTTYNHRGELTAYHISAGRLQFGKTFASR
jgi:hypothetical protein